MQHKAVSLLFCRFNQHVLGVNHTLSSGVHKTVTAASGTGHIFCVQLPPSNVAKYDQYRGLKLRFCVLLMMGVVANRNMYSELAE